MSFALGQRLAPPERTALPAHPGGEHEPLRRGELLEQLARLLGVVAASLRAHGRALVAPHRTRRPVAARHAAQPSARRRQARRTPRLALAPPNATAASASLAHRQHTRQALADADDLPIGDRGRPLAAADPADAPLHIGERSDLLDKRRANMHASGFLVRASAGARVAQNRRGGAPAEVGLAEVRLARCAPGPARPAEGPPASAWWRPVLAEKATHR